MSRGQLVAFAAASIGSGMASLALLHAVMPSGFGPGTSRLGFVVVLWPVELLLMCTAAATLRRAAVAQLRVAP